MDIHRVDKLLYVRINIHVLNNIQYHILYVQYHILYVQYHILRISSMWFILLCLLAVELPQRRSQHLVR